MESRHHDLLSDYNQYRSRTHHTQQMRATHPIKDLGPKRGLPIMARMDEWCRSQGIDSRRWLYHLFRKRRWLFAPVLTQLVPSKRHLIKALADYAAMTDTPGYEATIYRELEAARRQAGTDFDPNRDVSPMAEARKRIYLGEGRPDKCMAQMTTEAYGYHPKSTTCARCPATAQCATQLMAAVPFDILALRRGEMTLQQAQVIVGRASYGG